MVAVGKTLRTIMNEDQTPLTEIIWQRIRKTLGKPPQSYRAEIEWWKQVWANRLVIARSFLVVAAIRCIAHASDFAKTPPLEAALDVLPPYSNNASWYNATALIMLALAFPLLSAWMLRSWLYCRRHYFVPVAAFVFGWLWLWAERHPECSFLAWPFAILCLVCMCSLGWQQDDPEPLITDHLQRRYFVERLYELFKVPNATMKRIAIMGTWGSGKTTVLHLLRQKLHHSHTPKFAVAQVNPWTAKTPEEARSLLAGAFDEALRRENYYTSYWSRHPWLSWLTGLKSAIGIGLTFDLKQIFEGGSTIQEERLIQRVNRDLKAMKKICVILVDDMERADPEVIRKMFPIINLLRDIESCFFVFAIDPERVAKAFEEEEYRNIETKGYLDKVFDLQIELPEPRVRDVAKMCTSMINKAESPKLAACFSRIRDHLPTNPRDAIRFINDAKTKEVLFLSRYGNDEHEFSYFFILRLVELELPGITQKLCGEKAIKYHRSIHGVGHNSSDNDKLREELWEEVESNSSLRPGDVARLKKSFFEIFNAEDLDWMSHHYMRLLTPTAGERIALRDHWIKNAGKLSLVSMVKDFMPGTTFADEGLAAYELIEGEVHSYKRLRMDISISEEKHSLREQKEVVHALSQQVHFAVENKNRLELDIFGEDHFEEWGKIICSPLPVSDPATETTSLLDLEYSYHLQLSDILSFQIAYAFAGITAEEFIERWSSNSENNQDFCSSHLTKLREHLRTRVRSEILKWIQTDTLELQWKEAQMQQGTHEQLWSSPSTWIPDAEPEHTLALNELLIAASDSSESLNEIRKFLIATLERLSSILEFSTAFRKSPLIQHFSDNKSYYRCLWKITLSDRRNQASINQLFEKHENAMRAAKENRNGFTDQDLADIFPG